MQGIKDRSAYYECVICYFDSKPHFLRDKFMVKLLMLQEVIMVLDMILIS